jgi:predicted DNA-binding transcriptional regulator AlpA
VTPSTSAPTLKSKSSRGKKQKRRSIAQPASSSNPPAEAAQSTEQILVWKGVPVREMLAVPLDVACQLLGIGRTSLWKEMKLGRIRKTRLNTVPRSEIDRWLAEAIATPT